LIFWVYTPSNIGGIHQHFGGTYFLLIQEAVDSSENNRTGSIQ